MPRIAPTLLLVTLVGCGPQRPASQTADGPGGSPDRVTTASASEDVSPGDNHEGDSATPAPGPDRPGASRVIVVQVDGMMKTTDGAT